MFSIDSSRQADACRFCWMCRHICPVSNSTGNEGWTPRARGLMVSMIERGLPYDGEIAEAMYHCTLCDACANDCATGYKPSEFIREARTLAVVGGFAPKPVTEAIDRIFETGSIFGDKSAQAELCAAVGPLPEKAEVLLFAGQTACHVCPEPAVHAASLLKKAGVGFTMLKDEPGSGAILAELMGYTGDVQSVAAAAATRIRDSGAKTLVALSPADAVIFRDFYGKWGLLDGIEVVTATAFLAQLAAEGKLNIKPAPLAASLQEPVKLTRSLGEEEPFKALAAAAGIELKELFLHGKMSRCVGTVPLDFYDPVVVKEMVRVRCEDALRLDSHVLVTASPDDFWLMRRYALADVEIVDLFALLDGLC